VACALNYLKQQEFGMPLDFEESLALTLLDALTQNKLSRTPLRNGKPVVRLGRKATGQAAPDGRVPEERR